MRLFGFGAGGFLLGLALGGLLALFLLLNRFLKRFLRLIVVVDGAGAGVGRKGPNVRGGIVVADKMLSLLK